MYKEKTARCWSLPLLDYETMRVGLHLVPARCYNQKDRHTAEERNWNSFTRTTGIKIIQSP